MCQTCSTQKEVCDRVACSLQLCFVISVELLAIYLQNNPKLEGIKSKDNMDYLISQFADDTSMALKNKKDCVKNTFEALGTAD